MTSRFRFRIDLYKRYLRRLIGSKKGFAYKVKLTKPTARDIEAWAKSSVPGVAFTNVARDIRRVTEPGVDYDAEFDLLWRGQVVPEVIERYSEQFLAGLMKGVIAPCDTDQRLASLIRTRPDGRPVWEDV